MTGTGEIRYHEVQQFRQPWVWVLLLAVAAVAWYAYFQQVVFGAPFGSNPAPDLVVYVIAGVFGVVLPLFFYLLALQTEVREDGVYYRYFPVHLSFKAIPWTDIAGYSVVTYRPLRDYGGWGIRYGRMGKAYNVRGDRGVRFTFTSGKRLLIGSGDADAFGAAVAAASGIPEKKEE